MNGDRTIIALLLLAIIACAVNAPLTRYIDARRDQERKELVDRVVAATNNAAAAANHAATTIDNFRIIKGPIKR